MKKVCAGFAWLALSVLGHCAHGQTPGVVLQCRADLAPFGGITTVRITREDQGRLQAQIDGHVSSAEVYASEFPIRENINLKINTNSAEFSSFNPGEIALVHLEVSTTGDRQLAGTIRLPFDLSRVRRMKIYPLEGGSGNGCTRRL